MMIMSTFLNVFLTFLGIVTTAIAILGCGILIKRRMIIQDGRRRNGMSLLLPRYTVPKNDDKYLWLEEEE